MPGLTLVITSYGREAFASRALQAALQAVRGQDADILFMDDHSPGAAFQRLRSRFKAAKGLRLLRNPRNLGLIGNWNRALNLCRAPLAVFLGDDDQALPALVQSSLKAHAQDPALALSFGAYQTVDATGALGLRHRPLGSHPQTLAPAEFWSWCAYYFTPVTLCTAAFNVRGLKKNGGFDPRAWLAADGDAYLRMGATGSVFYDPQVLALNGFHPDQLQHGMAGHAMDQALQNIARRTPLPLGLQADRAWRQVFADFLKSRDRIASALGMPAGLERDRRIREAAGLWQTLPAHLPQRAHRWALASHGIGLVPAAVRFAIRAGRACRRRWSLPYRSPGECRGILQSLLLSPRAGAQANPHLRKGGK